ncbi:phospholipase D family protein [Serratia ureilytica]|uniref:phospholipase D family protein n=2 Tax=Serratia TaxID=613 RepID=UPI00214E6DDE|nr:phospholipase D family protein [Serratia ureilytica]UUW20603.1 phospholipase D family protein [Serratia ureilytica]
MIKIVVYLIIAVTIAIIAARVIFRLPDISQRLPQAALPADPAALLPARAAEQMAAHPGLSGVVPLVSGHDAFASRLALARMAERSIDAQYYIWHNDTSGQILLKTLYDAAQRGVRVRLLLDDNGVAMDETLAALNAQKNVEIRLFNPSTVRTPKLAGYAFDFMRMNRRMHNKSYIVDGAVAIIGGRNIGDEYFQVGDENYFLDLDVLSVGSVVAETADVFDRYWNSASVFGVEQIIRGQGNLSAFLTQAAATETSERARKLAVQLETSAVQLETSAVRFRDGAVQPEFTQVELVADDPAKGLGKASRDRLMVTQLGKIIGGVSRQLDLVSAYFVPGREGATFFESLAKQGKSIRVLTNAMNTTDVLVVHAGYAKYRRELLQAGVELFELKLRAGQPTGRKELKPLGLSGAALHAKTFAIDDKRVFIGSFNFDPRSAHLNCEMGFLIDSPSLAADTRQLFDGPLEYAAYRPVLTPEGKMVWKEAFEDGHTEVHQQEPGAGWVKRIVLTVAGWLPIEWML